MINDDSGNGSAPSLAQEKSSRVNELLKENDRSLPVWIRAPKSGHEYWSGLGRSKLYELSSHRKITCRSIREPGQVRGTRLFNLQSILDYIDSCTEPTSDTEIRIGPNGATTA